jgi:hypothetical protein
LQGGGEALVLLEHLRVRGGQPGDRLGFAFSLGLVVALGALRLAIVSHGLGETSSILPLVDRGVIAWAGALVVVMLLPAVTANVHAEAGIDLLLGQSAASDDAVGVTMVLRLAFFVEVTFALSVELGVEVA